MTKLSADNPHHPGVQTGAMSPQSHQLSCPFPKQDSCMKPSSAITFTQPDNLKATEFGEKIPR